MCLVVINAVTGELDQNRSQQVAARIGDVVNRARTERVPVAHLHQTRRVTSKGLGVPIGRYEPVFQANDLDAELPPGLIDFIIASPSQLIRLVGAATEQQFNRLHAILRDAGCHAEIESQAVFGPETWDESD